jgi:hypothetical protein
MLCLLRVLLPVVHVYAIAATWYALSHSSLVCHKQGSSFLISSLPRPFPVATGGPFHALDAGRHRN